MNKKKNIKRLNELRKFEKQLYNISVYINSEPFDYDEYMKDSVGHLKYEFAESEGDVDDDFVARTIEPEIAEIKLMLDKIKEMVKY